MINKTLKSLCFFAGLTLLVVGFAGATTLTENPALTQQGQGLDFVEGGVGLEGLGSGSVLVTVDIGGPVQAAYLYWAGRDRPCPVDGGGNCVIPGQPYLDQEMLFDGNPITGVIVGAEQNGEINNIGYRADVTGIVSARGTGVQSFTIADGDLNDKLWRQNGAGLLVIFTDESDPTHYRLIVYDGLDFAFGELTGAAAVTEPVIFSYDPATAGPTGELAVFCGDAGSVRPDRIDISDNASLVNTLTGSDGPSWDSPRVPVALSATGSTTVQLFSEPVHENPDSLMWELGVLRVPLEAPNFDIDIRKQAEGPDSRTFPSGIDVTFEIVVTNTGDADLTNVVVTDVLAPQCDQIIGDLAVGDSFTYTCTVPDVLNSFDNEACVEGEGEGGVMVGDCDPSSVEIIDINIRKQEEGPDTRTFPSGSDVTFEIVVTNTGDEDLTNVVVTDVLTPVCDRFIGDLAAGASVAYTCTAPDVTVGFTNEACVEGERNDVMVGDCDPSTVEVEVVGGEGCTPGYWRQPQHFGSWTGYAPNQLFSDVFGRVITVRTKGEQSNNRPYVVTDPTLLEAVWATSSEIGELARHAVAALLNAASADVDYVYTTDMVIAMFQAAYDSGDYGTTAGMFVMENERGCPLDLNPGVVIERAPLRSKDQRGGRTLPGRDQGVTVNDFGRN